MHVVQVTIARLTAFALVLGLALAAHAQTADDDGDLIADVRLSGNRRIEADAVLPLLETQPGEPVDREALRRDIRTLWAQRFFDDIQVDLTETPDGPVVTFIVQEKPLVREVRLVGNTELDEDDLRKELEIKPFQILDTEAGRRSAKKLESKYADKGFFLAEVRFRTEPAPGENQVDAVLDIIENAKVEVRRITIQGNRALSDEEIKNSIATREKSILSFLTSEGTYKEEVFQRDLLIIQSLYYNQGYINIRVGQPSVSLSPDKRFIYVTIPVEEGEPYDFGELTVGGDLLGEDEAVQSLITAQPGQRFSSQVLQQTLLSIQDFFRDRGYAYVEVQPQTAVDVATKTVDIQFTVTPGRLITIERIDVVGNTKTRDKVIRRELRIDEGDTYSGSGIRASRARVTALGFFEVVDITSRQGSSPDTMVLEVQVKEKATGTFQVGLGFSNQEPILLNANISQNNFLGYGWSVAFMTQWSRLRRIFSLSFTDPYFLDTRWTAAFDLYNTLQFYGSFDRRATGGTVTGGYELFEDFRVFTTLTVQQVDVVQSTTNTVPIANLFRGGFTNSIKGSFNYDRRDNRLFPTKGFLLSGSVEWAPELRLFEDENVFVRWVGIARGYWPLGAGFVAKVNATIGYIQSPVDNRVSVSERFFEGGINSLRGYDFRSVSPRVAVGGRSPGSPLDTIQIGGNKELLSNWEIEFPIVESFGLRGVVFFDAGNVYDDSQSFFDESAGGHFGLLMSAGFGARWFTPLGPLRFELGFPLTRRPGDDTSRFEFTIGNFF